jgi:hypothetical protein
MARTFKDLTDQQKKQYEAELKKIGIDRDSVAKKVVIDAPHDHMRDAARAKMKTQKVTVRDLAHLKELGGVPDTRYTQEKQTDTHLTYPQSLPAERHRALSALKDADSLHAAMEPHEHDAVNSAMRAYVLGNSTKVPKELVALANAAHFPTEAAVAAADDLTITSTYTVKAPPEKQALVVGKLTIVKPNGQIVAEGVDLSINAQLIEVTNG